VGYSSCHNSQLHNSPLPIVCESREFGSRDAGI
jgi:hypothetical protein